MFIVSVSSLQQWFMLKDENTNWKHILQLYQLEMLNDALHKKIHKKISMKRFQRHQSASIIYQHWNCCLKGS